MRPLVVSNYSSASPICTLDRPSQNNKRGSNIKYFPYAFTEQGIYMLMTVLKGDLAIRQSMALIRLFKQMKDYMVAENHQLIVKCKNVLFYLCS